MAVEEAACAGVTARGITKLFPGIRANDGVDFDARPGEVHALLGENGSGKSTLCKVLTGLYRPNAGSIIVGGREVRFHSPADAFEAGVFMVHQHFSLVEPMTVAENVVLGWSQHSGMRFDPRRAERDVAEAAERFGMPIDPSAFIWQLSMGERQRVEILKALYRGARTLILDEPTTVLTPQEAKHLFRSLRELAATGSSVIFISHKLHEVLDVCDRVTVLRNGRTEGVVDLHAEGEARVDARALANLMVGREIELGRRTRSSGRRSEEVVLEVRDLSVDNEWGRRTLASVSLQVFAGEVVGIAGVAGNGQRELAETIAGLVTPAEGQVEVNGRRLPPGRPSAAIDRGVAFVPEDRLGVGLAPGLTVSDNVLLKRYRTPAFSRGPFVRSQAIRSFARELIETFNIKAKPESLIRQLSGGNAQKVLLSRELSLAPKVLVVAAPTRGLDIAAMAAVRDLMIAAADDGVAVLMISEDLDELLDLADRIAVICNGRITGVVDADGADVVEIGMMMMGEFQAGVRG